MRRSIWSLFPILVLGLSGLLPIEIWAAKPFDEMRTPSGRYRAPYRTAALRRARTREGLGDALVERLERSGPFNDKIEVVPEPIYLSYTESDQIVLGGMQRARALNEFFKDLVFGEARALDPERGLGISQKWVDAALLGSGYTLRRIKKLWRRHRPEEVHFFHGADVIRGPDGKFYVLEDNVGPIGGKADKLALSDFYSIALDQSKSPHWNSSHPMGHLALITAYDLYHFVGGISRDVGLTRENTLVLWASGSGKHQGARRNYDAENERWDFLTWMLIPRAVDHNYAWIGIDHEEDYAEEEFNVGDRAYWGVGRPGPVREFLQARADINESIGIIYQYPLGLDSFRGLEILELFAADSRIRLMHAPGADDLLGSKVFLSKVDKMIRFYLGEEPILKSPYTSPPLFSPDEIHQFLKDNGNQFVLKAINEARGDGIYILPRMAPHDVHEMFVRFQGEWATGKARFAYIAQEFVEPSLLEGQTVDFRPIVRINGNGTARALTTPWARSIPVTENFGKTNVSQGARERLVVTIPTRKVEREKFLKVVD